MNSKISSIQNTNARPSNNVKKSNQPKKTASPYTEDWINVKSITNGINHVFKYLGDIAKEND